jgi:hypothetical protein
MFCYNSDMICIVENCQRESKAKHQRSYCTMHYTRLYRHGSVDPDIRSYDPDRGCKIEGCKRSHDSKGFCQPHYKKWRQENPVAVCLLVGCGRAIETRVPPLCSTHNSFIKKNKNIDMKSLEQVYKNFNGCCDICGSTSTQWSVGVWHTDHDHETGKVRGLLCQMCNTGLGRFFDDILLLEKAIEYLKKSKT